MLIYEMTVRAQRNKVEFIVIGWIIIDVVKMWVVAAAEGAAMPELL
jgi:hypothetical protein